MPLRNIQSIQLWQLGLCLIYFNANFWKITKIRITWVTSFTVVMNLLIRKLIYIETMDLIFRMKRGYVCIHRLFKHKRALMFVNYVRIFPVSKYYVSKYSTIQISWEKLHILQIILIYGVYIMFRIVKNRKNDSKILISWFWYQRIFAWESELLSLKASPDKK